MSGKQCYGIAFCVCGKCYLVSGTYAEESTLKDKANALAEQCESNDPELHERVRTFTAMYAAAPKSQRQVLMTFISHYANADVEQRLWLLFDLQAAQLREVAE